VRVAWPPPRRRTWRASWPQRQPTTRRAARLRWTPRSPCWKEAAAADAAETGKGDAKREAIRALLADLLYVLCVEARDATAGRAGSILTDVSRDGAARLLERLGAIASAVPANVTPAVLLIETYRALRAEVRRNA
jgi:hypothetical protein